MNERELAYVLTIDASDYNKKLSDATAATRAFTSEAERANAVAGAPLMPAAGAEAAKRNINTLKTASTELRQTALATSRALSLMGAPLVGDVMVGVLAVRGALHVTGSVATAAGVSGAAAFGAFAAAALGLYQTLRLVNEVIGLIGDNRRVEETSNSLANFNARMIRHLREMIELGEQQRKLTREQAAEFRRLFAEAVQAQTPQEQSDRLRALARRLQPLEIQTPRVAAQASEQFSTLLREIQNAGAEGLEAKLIAIENQRIEWEKKLLESTALDARQRAFLQSEINRAYKRLAEAAIKAEVEERAAAAARVGRELALANLSGRERDLAKIALDYKQKLAEIAKLQGISEEQRRRLNEQAAEAAARQVEELARSRLAPPAAPQFSSLERMGFRLFTTLGTGATDSSRQIERNTRDTVIRLDRIVNRLNSQTGVKLVNI